MTTLLARFGHLEARSAAQTIRSSGSRSEWVCLECRETKTKRGNQVRSHSDVAGLRPTFRTRTQDAVLVKGRRGFHGGDSLRWPVKNKKDVEKPGHTVRLQRTERSQSRTERPTGSSSVEEGEQDEKAIEEGTLLDIDYVSLFPDAMETRDVDLVSRCIFAAKRKHDLSFIRSIPDERFTEILEILEPKNVMLDFAPIHSEMSPSLIRQMGLSGLNKAADHHQMNLMNFVNVRRDAGSVITLADYTILLRAARDLGRTDLAQVVWRQMESRGITPDVTCWNYHMAAIVAKGHLGKAGQHRDRVTTFNMTARTRSKRGHEFSRYRVGPGGVKQLVMMEFSKMLQGGIVPNGESYRVIIMAAAREGDMNTVKSLIRRTWGVDVDALMRGDEEDKIMTKSLEKSSPVYPTQDLLFTLAHAFGINNDIPTALRVVDFVSRMFELPIEKKTWNQLLQWTFVLSAKRTGANIEASGAREGQLPKESVANFWKMMTSAPYFVEPTMPMYNQLLKSQFNRDRIFEMADTVQKGHKLASKSLTRAKTLLGRLKVESARLVATGGHPDVNLQRLRRDYELAELTRRRDKHYMARWKRLMLAATRKRAKFEGYEDGEWTLRTLPQLMWRVKAFVPTNVTVETSGGTLQFRFHSIESLGERYDGGAKRQGKIDEVLARVPRFVGDGWWRVSHPSSRGENTTGRDADEFEGGDGLD